VNVWEEEISDLKAKIEQLKDDHKEEINTLKLLQIPSKENEKSKEPISLCSKRKALESSWMKIVDSAPKEKLDKNTVEEVRKLKEMKNYIQLECDQLLVERDKLQENIQSICPGINSKGKHSQFHTEDLSTVGQAYKAVLDDIQREVSLTQADLLNPDTNNKLLLHSLLQRLEHQVSRSQHLQSSLALARVESSHHIAATREQHISDISQLEYLVTSSQDLVRKQTRRYMEQIDSVIFSDNVLEKLYNDNQNTMDQLKEMKKKILVQETVVPI